MDSSARIIASYYHTPSEIAQKVFVTTLRAGHLLAGPDYRIERWTCAGHDLLLCLKGRGFIQIGGRSHPVEPGQLGWLNGHHPHAHWADPTNPWELLWARIDGHTLEQISDDLEIRRWPVFDLADPRHVAKTLRRILRAMRRNPPAMEAYVNAEAAFLLASLYETRQRSRLAPTSEVPGAMQTIIDRLNVYFYRTWRVEELAKMSGMSVPNFFRSFRRATGSTPISFLRRVRINQAKRRLIESTDSIKEVAEQVGYSDQFYFSRDFKHHTGVSPSDFRRHELGNSLRPLQRGSQTAS
jgi:AraC-like DNA-binding protein